MKKLALALVCLFSVAFFASCDPEEILNQDPTIQVYEEDGYVQDGETVNTGEEISFGFVVASNPNSNKELASLLVKVDDVVWTEDGEAIDLTGMTEYTFTDVVTYEANRDQILGTSVITAIVTDAAGETATATITLTINQPDQPLFGTPIEWTRKGNNLLNGTAEDMASYGLEWPGNWKAPMVIIRPTNSNVMLYLCDGNDFDDIKTVSDKNAYFTNLAETATPIEKYNNITTNNSADYNDMLAVVNGENLHLIRISHAEVEYLGSSIGTQIIITGDVK